MSDEKPVTITALEVKNVMRIRVVRIRPDGSPVIVIGGDNEQGKSTLLNSIEMLFGGKRKVPAEPIRRGAHEAHIIAKLSNGLSVEREFTASGGTEVVVKDVKGVEQSSPQTILNELYSEIAFEPLEFTYMKTEEQDRILKKVLGLDFTELDQRKAELEQARKEANKDLKTKRAQLNATPEHEGVPAKEESVAELTAELDRRRELARQKEGRTEHADQLDVDVNQCRGAVERTKKRITEIESELAAAQKELLEHEQDLVANRKAAEDARRAAEAFTYPDPAEIRAKLDTVEDTNAKVRSNKQRAKLQAEVDELDDGVAAIKSALDEVAQDKADRLAKAEFPVPGLGFDETGPTLNGFPLEQASQSQKIRLSVAIGFALKPKLKVLLIRRGSELNTKNLQLLAELAEQHGGQVWLEKVSEDGKGCSVVLEDGAVRESTEAAE